MKDNLLMSWGRFCFWRNVICKDVLRHSLQMELMFVDSKAGHVSPCNLSLLTVSEMRDVERRVFSNLFKGVSIGAN